MNGFANRIINENFDRGTNRAVDVLCQTLLKTQERGADEFVMYGLVHRVIDPN